MKTVIRTSNKHNKAKSSAYKNHTNDETRTKKRKI